MADITRLLAIDNAGPNSDGSYDITVLNQRVTRVTVQEDFDSTSPATADLRQKAPASASNFVKIPKGTPAIYTAVRKNFFEVLDRAGTIKTAAGSINVQIIESIEI